MGILHGFPRTSNEKIKGGGLLSRKKLGGNATGSQKLEKRGSSASCGAPKKGEKFELSQESPRKNGKEVVGFCDRRKRKSFVPSNKGGEKGRLVKKRRKGKGKHSLSAGKGRKSADRGTGQGVPGGRGDYPGFLPGAFLERRNPSTEREGGRKRNIPP